MESRVIAPKEADEVLLGWESRSSRVCFAVCMGELAWNAHWVGTIRNARPGRWVRVAGQTPRPRTTTTAAQAMIPLEKLSSIDPDAELWKAMKKMGRDGINQMPVMLGNNLVGMLSRGDIVKYLQTLQQVGG